MFFNLLDKTFALKYLHKCPATIYQYRPVSRNWFLQNGNSAGFAATVSILKDGPCPSQFITVICSKRKGTKAVSEISSENKQANSERNSQWNTSP